MPSGSDACDPTASFEDGTPNSTIARTPRVAVSAASLRRDSSVCWNCPGIEEIGTGSLTPSSPKTDAIRWWGASSVSLARERRASVRRILRGRLWGKLTFALLFDRFDRAWRAGPFSFREERTHAPAAPRV